jgi:hypothetical protein
MCTMRFAWPLGTGLLTRTILAKNNPDTPARIAYPKPKAGKVTIAAIDDEAYDDDAAYNSSDDWPQYEVKQSDLD